jgi:hypothetical protein
VAEQDLHQPYAAVRRGVVQRRHPAAAPPVPAAHPGPRGTRGVDDGTGRQPRTSKQKRRRENEARGRKATGMNKAPAPRPSGHWAAPVIVLLLVHVGALREQRCGHCLVPVRSGQMQRRHPAVVSQTTSSVHAAPGRGDHATTRRQWRRPSAAFRAALAKHAKRYGPGSARIPSLPAGRATEDEADGVGGRSRCGGVPSVDPCPEGTLTVRCA